MEFNQMVETVEINIKVLQQHMDTEAMIQQMDIPVVQDKLVMEEGQVPLF
jgi:hypothetical protein